MGQVHVRVVFELPRLFQGRVDSMQDRLTRRLGLCGGVRHQTCPVTVPFQLDEAELRLRTALFEDLVRRLRLTAGTAVMLQAEYELEPVPTVFIPLEQKGPLPFEAVVGAAEEAFELSPRQLQPSPRVPVVFGFPREMAEDVHHIVLGFYTNDVECELASLSVEVQEDGLWKRFSGIDLLVAELESKK